MFDSLYENIGRKIKNWAKWIFIVEAIGAIITGFILMAEVDVLYILLVFLGPIIAWVGSWILYAFGELVEDVHAIRNKEGTTAEEKANFQQCGEIEHIETKYASDSVVTDFWTCSCQRENSVSRTECWHCGAKRP